MRVQAAAAAADEYGVPLHAAAVVVEASGARLRAAAVTVTRVARRQLFVSLSKNVMSLARE